MILPFEIHGTLVCWLEMKPGVRWVRTSWALGRSRWQLRNLGSTRSRGDGPSGSCLSSCFASSADLLDRILRLGDFRTIPVDPRPENPTGFLDTMCDNCELLGQGLAVCM